MRLLKLFAQYATGSILTLLAGLITTPILTRLISTEEMGKYSMFITMGSLIASILYLGLDQSYVRFYYDEREENRNHFFKVCLGGPVIATMFSSIVLLISYKDVSEIMVGSSSIWIMFVFDLYILGLVVNRFGLLKIRMEQKAGTYSLLNVFRKLSYLAIALVLYFNLWGDDCFSLIFAVVLAEIVLSIGCMISDYGNWKDKSKKISTSMPEIVKYGFPFIFSTTITLVFQSTDKLMLNALTDYHEIGIYTGAQNIVNLLIQVQTVFATFWMPVAFEHFSQDQDDKSFFIKANRVISYCMLVISILLLCAKDIVILFLGEKYRDAVYVFPFLAFMPIMYTVSETTVVGINFMKKSSYHVWISLASALVNIVLNFSLITKLGAKGAAISTGLAYMVFFALRTVLANKVYPIKFSLGRFSISIIAVYGLAIAASFMDVTPKFLCLAAIIMVVISVFYRDVIGYGIELIKTISVK